VHYTGIEGEGYRSLEEGERVSYEPIRGRKGEQARACARSSRYGPVLALIHPSAEMGNSQKFTFTILNSSGLSGQGSDSPSGAKH